MTECYDFDWLCCGQIDRICNDVRFWSDVMISDCSGFGWLDSCPKDLWCNQVVVGVLIDWLYWCPRTCEAIMEFPDWNVDERERGMIDLKRRIFHWSWIFSLATNSQQKGGKIHSSWKTDFLVTAVSITFTAKDWRSESLSSKRSQVGHKVL